MPKIRELVVVPCAHRGSSRCPTLSLRAAGHRLYFTFLTGTATGRGDIVPLHPVARSLSPTRNRSSATMLLEGSAFIAYADRRS